MSDALILKLKTVESIEVRIRIIMKVSSRKNRIRPPFLLYSLRKQKIRKMIVSALRESGLRLNILLDIKLGTIREDGNSEN